MTKSMAFLLAVFAGIFMGAQPAINGFLGKEVTTKLAVLISLGISAFLIAIINIPGFSLENIKQLKNVHPFYILAGGTMGVFIVYFPAKVVPVLGSTVAISIFIVVQLIISVMIDHFGLFGITQSLISVKRLLGISFLLIGLNFIIR